MATGCNRAQFRTIEEDKCANLNLVWAKQGGEWWPAHLKGLGSEGMHLVSFIGWGRRHDMEVQANDIRQEEPQRQRSRPIPLDLSDGGTPERHKRAKHAHTPHRTSRSSPGAPETPGGSPPPRLKLKVVVPSDDSFECAACGGRGTASQMLRCSMGSCDSWVHRCCAGRDEEAPPPVSHPRRSYACPLCVPPPSEAESAPEPPPMPPPPSSPPLPSTPMLSKALAALGGASSSYASSASSAARAARATVAKERQLLADLCADRLMESDVRKHLRRCGLPTVWEGRRDGRKRQGCLLACDLAATLRQRLAEHLRFLIATAEHEAEKAAAEEAAEEEAAEVTVAAGAEAARAVEEAARAAEASSVAVSIVVGSEALESVTMEIEKPVTPTAAKYRCASPANPYSSRTEIITEIGAPETPNRTLQTAVKTVKTEEAASEASNAPDDSSNAPEASSNASVASLSAPEASSNASVASSRAASSAPCAGCLEGCDACGIRCPVCAEELEATAAATARCQLCGVRMHARCSSLRLSSQPPPTRRLSCAECDALSDAVSTAFARAYGWAAPEIGRSTEALHTAAVQVRPVADAAIIEQACACARRVRTRALSGQGPRCSLIVEANAYFASWRTATRLRLAAFGPSAVPLVGRGRVGGGGGGGGNADERVGGAALGTALGGGGGGAGAEGWCRYVLEAGGAELFFLVMGRLDDTLALRSTACVCAEWSHLLDRSRSCEAAAVWRQAVLTAPRGRLTLAAALRSTRPGDRLRIAAGVHSAPLLVPHPLHISAVPGAIITGPITLTDPRSVEISRDRPRSAEIGPSDSAAPGAGPGRHGRWCEFTRQGRLSGLRVEHFYETAITVLGGWWTLENIEVVSSQAPKRACVGVLLRAAAHVDVVQSVITGASSVITLGSPHASLVAHDCTFGNTRAAIASERGGVVDVRRCSFSLELPSDVGFRLAADTRGFVGVGLLASPSTSGGSLWGRVLPPKEVCVEAEEADEGVAAGAS